MLILVSVLICLLFHIVLNPAITPAALAILLLISLLQSLSQVSKLPRYTNSVTFSILLPLISISSSMSSCPNTIVIVFSMLICNAAASPASLIRSRFPCNSTLSSSSRTMSSANLRLLILYPWTDIPVPLSLTESITLSRYEMNIVGDIGSPCLVPTVVLNQSPISSPTRTADCEISLMFCSILINLAPTPYDLSVAQVTSCSMESNAFWKSTKQLMMCRPLRFANTRFYSCVC